jgi:acyl dehydratase
MPESAGGAPTHSRRVTFDPARVRRWAETACDHNPLHLDPEFAACSRFGVPITHGHLLACVVVDTVQQQAGQRLTHGGRLSMRFRSPVPVGDELLVEYRASAGGDPTVQASCGDIQALHVELALAESAQTDETHVE